MGGVTDTQSLRFDVLSDVISLGAVKNLADDVAVQLDAADVPRTAGLKRPICRGRRSAALSVAAATTVTVPFDVEVWDTHNMLDVAGPNPSRFTVGAAAGVGLYYVGARVQVAGGVSFTRTDIQICKNAGMKYQDTQWGQIVGHLYVAGYIWLGATTDFLTVTVSHIGGGTVNMSGIDMWCYKAGG